MEHFWAHVGNVLRYYRQKNNLRGIDVAQSLNMATAAVYERENGNRKTDLRYLWDFCQLTGESFAEVCTMIGAGSAALQSSDDSKPPIQS